MVRFFTERLLLLSVIGMVIEAILPDTALGRFARGAAEVVMLMLILEPIASVLLSEGV